MFNQISLSPKGAGLFFTVYLESGNLITYSLCDRAGSGLAACTDFFCTPPNHLCVFDFCKTYSRSSSSCTFYIAFVSLRQQLDDAPHIHNIVSSPSRLSCNALAYLPAHSLCTMNALRFWCLGFSRTYSRLSTFCICCSALSSPLGLRFTTNSTQPNRPVALLHLSFSLSFLKAKSEYYLSCR